jgi:hypothetical protein
MFNLYKRSRIYHWSCSKLADKIRGTEKPFALEWSEWDVWHEKTKKKHPFRYWVADEFLDYMQDFVNLPMDIYHTIDIYIRNRFIHKVHYLRTDLTPGQYYDLDTRILHALFTELTDLVEVEYASIQRYSEKENNYVFTKGRCPLAGLDYLNWAGQLKYDENMGFNIEDEFIYNKPTPQAEAAQTTLELYNWWKNRDNRKNPYDLYTEEKDGPQYYLKIDDMEQEYDKEDTDMLIKLIQIRGSLWT